MIPSDPIVVMRVIARLNIGGPAIHVSILTAGLNDETFRSMLVTGITSESEGDMAYMAREMDVEPILIPSMGREISPLGDLRALIALLRLIAKERPHVVHTHTAKAGFIGRLAAFLSDVPVIVHTFHGHVFRGYFGALKTQVFIWMERLAARLSDAVLTISPRLREELISFGIAAPERIHVIPLGLELQDLAGLDDRRGVLRGELGYSTDVPLIGIIGRLVPIKNHELFLTAAQRIAQCMPGARFIIAGDGECRAILEGLVAQMELTDAVHFLGWRRDLPIIYADLDVLVITSRNEGTPVSIIEAMATGVPVVATAVGGIPDILCEGELGMLVPLDDLDALVESIVETLNTRPEKRLLKAQRWATEHYGSQRLVADVRALYLHLLQEKGFLSERADQGQADTQ